MAVRSSYNELIRDRAALRSDYINRDLQIGVRVRLFKLGAFAFDYHISHQSRTDSLLFNWSATVRSEGSENITGLKFESRTRSPM